MAQLRARRGYIEASKAELVWALAMMLAWSLVPMVRATASTDPVARVDEQGRVDVPATAVPVSTFMSEAARKRFIQLFAHPQPSPPPGAEIRIVREFDEQKNAPLVARARELYPVDIERQVIGGVSVQVIVPQAGVAPANRNRVLMNLHGGGFQWGESNGALAESIPIAGLGRITVIAVSYRMAPEFKFPAASEDVAAVYRELLKAHRPHLRLLRRRGPHCGVDRLVPQAEAATPRCDRHILRLRCRDLGRFALRCAAPDGRTAAADRRGRDEHAVLQRGIAVRSAGAADPLAGAARGISADAADRRIT